MSLIAWKLGLTTLIPVINAGVAYSLATQLSGVQEIELKTMKDFKDNCLVSLFGGKQGENSSVNKKLLVCSVSKEKDFSNIRFYFYDTETKTSDILPKEVTKVKENGQWEIILSLLEGREETISVSQLKWKLLFNKDLRRDCKINQTESDTYKLSCKEEYPQTLDKFEISNSVL